MGEERGTTGRWPWLAALAAVLTLLAYGLLASRGWPGAPSACLAGDPCWCEPQRPGWFREPLNTVSNVPVLLASVALAGLARRAVAPRQRTVLRVFAYAMWAQGAGALFFHGSLTQWSRWFDQTSVLMVWGAILSTSLLRLGWLELRWLPAAVAGSGVLAFAYVVPLGWDLNVGGLACLGSFFAAEVALRRRDRSPPRARRSFRVALASFVASLVAWALSIPGTPLCESAFPAHALWHLFVGGAVFCLGLYAADAAQEGRGGRSRRDS